jgi:nicotinate-nucleotide adenylyltransferase
MRLGLFGGTFDPIHLGHLTVAQSVAEQLDLDQIWFLPAGQPWMRRREWLTPAQQRREMVELAVRSNPRFALCTAELDRPGDTYTVDTLEQLRSERGDDDEFFFIMGADTLVGFSQWKDPARILELATVVVARRPDYSWQMMTALEAQLSCVAQRIRLLQTPLLEVSATEVRRRTSDGQYIRDLVPLAVAEYIEAHGLYQKEPPGAQQQGGTNDPAEDD